MVAWGENIFDVLVYLLRQCLIFFLLAPKILGQEVNHVVSLWLDKMDSG